MRVPRFDLLLVAGLAALTLTGCGGSEEMPYSQAEVSGTVTYQGVQLEKGLIRFVPDSNVVGKPIYAKIEQGSYQVPADKGACVGKNRVEITGFRGTGKKEQTPEAEEVEIEEQYIPEKYNSQSTLTVDIQEEKNVKNFELK
jgi:hypothetical protein